MYPLHEVYIPEEMSGSAFIGVHQRSLSYTIPLRFSADPGGKAMGR